MTLRACFVLVLLGANALACGGRTSTAQGGNDGGGSVDGSVTPVDASADGSSPDATPTTCHDLANTGNVIPVSKGTPGGGSPPLGPPPPPGLYKLASAISFGAKPPKTLRETVRVRDDGMTWDVIVEVDGGPPQVGTYRLDASDPSLDVNVLPVCGPLPPLRVRFLALGSTQFALEVLDPEPMLLRFL